MTQLSIEDLSVEIEGKRLVDEVLFDLQPGEFVGLVGPNGSGKSSLLRAIYRVLKPAGGRVVHLGDNVWKLPARDAARRTAVVAQERMGEFDFTVRELVQMGRTPHKGLLDGDSAADRDIVERCLAEVGMAHCATRSFLSLSGGEKQRVLVARALAQQAPFLVLDEPTNHLDIRHQLELLELIRRLKTTTLAALHDLTLAARYCDRLAMLHSGKLIAFGTPVEVLTAERIREAFGVQATIASRDGRVRIEFDLER
ncbi:MAG TPA: ABC transporter ATP-binding protein [Devosia sp.]|jgi:iron complex transport system ATP-binding protein|uniref:ABC transporter ATP-binding protein n=1 Tax=Devosia sp. TaxID=1871048 RepID=UPI002DDCA338|nr:ABC transporter ATP-binding protein [Devosia sp.]HEV2516095.1 ABC transporter ATP-binding protein [Devosia sp.]